MELRDTYNRIAEDWSKDHKDDDWWVEATNHFVSLLPPGGRVLDVGCGAGIKTRYLVSKGLKVLGIDFSEKFVEIAQREVSTAEFRLLDMRNVEELGESFDGVFAQASLLHIPRAEVGEMVARLASVLKPAGYLYIAVKGVNEKEEDVVQENDYGYEYERFFSFHRMGELEEHVKKADLEVVYVNTTTVGKTNWLQIIAKK